MKVEYKTLLRGRN